MSQPVSGINPKILVWARESAGQTLAEVAAAVKKEEEVVRSWEEGTAAPTYVQLEALAYKVYKRPVALFFFPEPPSEPDPRHEFRTLPDTEIEELGADTRLKVREAVALQLSLAELTGGVNPAPRRILKDLTITSLADARSAAKRVRDYLGINLDQQSEWTSREQALKEWRAAVEDVGVFVFKDSFKDRDVSGFSLYDSEFPVIVINNSTAPSRQIFTLFHELGHLLAHEGGVTKEDDQFINFLSGEARRIEVFCNQFAAEFLVPLQDFRSFLRRVGTGEQGIAELSDRYKVSKEVILRRLLDMGLVSSEFYEQRAKQWARDYEQFRVARRGKPTYYRTKMAYLSERYTNLAFSSYYRGVISVEKLADYLNVKVRSVPGLEQAFLQRAAKQPA